MESNKIEVVGVKIYNIFKKFVCKVEGNMVLIGREYGLN